MPNLPLCHWSSQLFDLCAPSSTNVPALLLNQAISKTSDPSASHPKQNWILNKMGRNECFFWPRQYCWGDWGGGGGGGGMNELKPIKQLSLWAITWVTINWKGFFTQSQVLLSSIVAYKPIHFALLNWKLYHVLYRSIKKCFLNVNNNSIPGPLYSVLSRNWPLCLKAMLYGKTPNDDFQPITAFQHCCEMVSDYYNNR